MKLTIDGLINTKEWQNTGITLPKYDIRAVTQTTKQSPIWVHFGIGNIFRIFLGRIADDLLNQREIEAGITCVDSFDFDMIDKIYTPYDNLALAVTLKANGSTEKRVIGSLREAIKATPFDTKSWSRLKEIFCADSLQMVSFTITEKGYALNNSQGEYFPFILEDMNQGPDRATTAMGIICAMLYERYKNGEKPLAVVSMDNCSHNGERLQKSVTTMAEEWLKRGLVPKDFLNFIKDSSKISFPWTMIDKITPRPSKEIAAQLKQDGLENMDLILTQKKTYIAPFVNAEGPQYLVIEDHFPNGRPPLEKAGVYMTDRDTVNRVEKMKVSTCLNPLHTGLAVYGCLLDYHLIADEMKDKELIGLVIKIGQTEGMPVVTDPKIIQPEKFLYEVIHERLPNPYIPDTPQRIACDTSQKVGVRYGETIKSYVEKYGSADRLTAIPLVIAGWCRYLLGVDDEGNSFECSPDPMLAELTARLHGIELGKQDTYQGQLKQILSNKNIFGVNLYQTGVGNKIEEMFLCEIAGIGAVRDTLQKYI